MLPSGTVEDQAGCCYGVIPGDTNRAARGWCVKLRQTINTVQSRHDHPAYGWAAVAAAVAVTDLTARRSMSDAFRTASRNKVTGPVLFLGWGYLSAHLFGFIPSKFDLLHLVSHAAGHPCQRCK